MVVVLRLHDRNWNTELLIKDIVRKFSLLLIAAGKIAAHGHGPRCEGDLASDLSCLIPSRAFDRRRNKEIADIALAEALFVYHLQGDLQVSCPRRVSSPSRSVTPSYNCEMN